MRLGLAKLRKSDAEAQKIKTKELKEGLGKYINVDRVLEHQGLSFVPEIIQTKLISYYHDNSLIGHFAINKIRKLINRKYYWPSLRKDVKAYIKGYDVCLTSKTGRHKPYSNLQALQVLTH